MESLAALQEHYTQLRKRRRELELAADKIWIDMEQLKQRTDSEGVWMRKALSKQWRGLNAELLAINTQMEKILYDQLELCNKT